MSPRRIDPKRKEQPSGMPTWAIAVGIGVFVVIAAVALFMLQTPSTPTPLPNPDIGTPVSGRTKGDASAKFELIEYSDFQ